MIFSNPHRFRRRLQFGRWLAIFFFAVLGVALARAQTGATTGSINGRASDGATGRSLQGAVVRVLGTTAVDYTDAEGRFLLPAVPAGDFTLEVEYVGLDFYRQPVTIAPGTALTVRAELQSDALKLEAFTVAESARGAALAINQQKTASGIVNIVSEETFGQMSDGNIGYALQRLPGITVNEGADGQPNSFNIRGLPSEFNSFQIDGNRVPTSGGGRGFSSNQLVADGVSNIEVIKAATPDRDGDAIGGIVNVISRSAFERDGRSIKLTGSGIYYDFRENWGYNAGLTFSDIYSVGGEMKNLGVTFTVSTYENSRDYDNNDTDYTLLTPANNPTLNLTEPIYFVSNSTIQDNIRETESYGFSATVDFRTNERNTFYLKPVFSRNEGTSEQQENRVYIDTRHQESRTGRKTIGAATATSGRSGPNSLGRYQYSNNESTSENDLSALSFGGRHQLETITVSYDLFVSRNKGVRDRSSEFLVDNPGFAFEYSQTNRQRVDAQITNGADPLNLATASAGELVISPRTKTEDVLSAKLDWEKKFVAERFSGSLKTGVKYRSSEPEQDVDAAIYSTGTGAAFPYANVFKPGNGSVNGRPMLLVPDVPKVEALFRSNPGLFELEEVDSTFDSLINDYSAKEETSAAYVMGTLSFGQSRLIAGVRMERNEQSADAYQVAEDSLVPQRISRSKSYTEWLPGVHFWHELRKNLILRASYNRSYGRPDLEAITLGRIIDEDGNIESGNPDLDPTTSNNFDLQLEYYTNRGGLYSAGLFYKRMKGFYYELDIPFNNLDASGNPIFDEDGELEFTRTENALGAENYGIELIARQKLFFLPAPLDGFGVALSATFSESDGKYPTREQDNLPTYGFSDYIFHSALEYVKGKFRAQVTYRYRSEYLEGIEDRPDLDDWFAAREQVDFESSYQATERLRYFLNLDNLTARPQISWQGNPRNPEDATRTAYRATLGANLTF